MKDKLEPPVSNIILDNIFFLCKSLSLSISKILIKNPNPCSAMECVANNLLNSINFILCSLWRL